MPGRSWKLYDRPPSVGAGSETARSGTSWRPALPPTLRKPVSPSFVSAATCISGGVVGEGRVDVARGSRLEVSTVSVPPRWPAPEARTATKSDPESTTIPSGRFPVFTGLDAACPDAGRSSRGCRRARCSPRRASPRPRCRSGRRRPGSSPRGVFGGGVDARDRAVEAVRDPDRCRRRSPPRRRRCRPGSAIDASRVARRSWSRSRSPRS